MSRPECGWGKISIAGTSFKWEIEKADVLDRQVSDRLTSSPFYTLNGKWRINLFPRGMSKEYENHISIFLELLHCVQPLQIRVTVSLLYDSGAFFQKSISPAGDVYITDSILGSFRFCEYDKFIRCYVNNSKTSKITILHEFIPDTNTRIEDILEPLGLRNALNNQQYSDVKFLVEGKNIYAHKVILANKSKVFAAMFEHQMKENINNVVEIEDVEHEVLLELFRYIYSGTINCTDDIAGPLFVAADKYEVIDLKSICSQYLESNLSVKNVKDCLDIADRHAEDSLKIKATNFIISHANEMVDTSGFEMIAESHPEVVRGLSEKK